MEMGTISCLTVNRMVTELSKAYCSVIQQGLPVTLLPSVMLWGPPGVGKSQGIKELAKVIEGKTEKRVAITDVRLILFNPIDLRGIPTSNADRTLAVWLKPKIFQMDESDEVINILFLDEISTAPQSVQAAAYQITLDRMIGEHKLPKNCIVIAAGNRITDKSVAFKMPKALANRLCHIEIKGSFRSWKKWAIASGIHPKVLGFLEFQQIYLMEADMNDDELAFATPRSWEMVSNILNYVDDDIDRVYNLIAGCVGTGIALEFRTWSHVCEQLPSMEDIFDGRIRNVPSSPDVLYALISNMTLYAKEHKNEMERIANSIQYAKLLPADFSTVLLRNYMYIEKGYEKQLMCLPEYAQWLQRNGRYMNYVDER